MTTEQTLPPLDENQIIAERRDKLKAIREKGIAFPNDFDRKNMAGDLHAEFGEKTHDELEAAQIHVAVAGRMMLKRVMGKASFATVQDMSGRIQLFISNDKCRRGSPRRIQALRPGRHPRRQWRAVQDQDRRAFGARDAGCAC